MRKIPFSIIILLIPAIMMAQTNTDTTDVVIGIQDLKNFIKEQEGYTYSRVIDSLIKNSSIIVKYGNEKKEDSSTIKYYLNGSLVDNKIIGGTVLDPIDIESINVVKDLFDDKFNHYSKIMIKTKKKLKINTITLKQLREKYIKRNIGEVIYVIDDKIIYTNPDEYLVNEAILHSIAVEEIEYSDVKILQIKTKFFIRHNVYIK